MNIYPNGIRSCFRSGKRNSQCLNAFTRRENDLLLSITCSTRLSKVLQWSHHFAAFALLVSCLNFRSNEEKRSACHWFTSHMLSKQITNNSHQLTQSPVIPLVQHQMPISVWPASEDIQRHRGRKNGLHDSSGVFQILSGRLTGCVSIGSQNTVVYTKDISGRYTVHYYTVVGIILQMVSTWWF